MATIEVPISDEKLLALLAEARGLSVGQGQVREIDIRVRPPEANSVISHHVSVTIEYGLKLGEVEDLVGF